MYCIIMTYSASCCHLNPWNVNKYVCMNALKLLEIQYFKASQFCKFYNSFNTISFPPVEQTFPKYVTSKKIMILVYNFLILQIHKKKLSKDYI
jgi:hypothetical protein